MFGEYIKELRQKRGLSQRELGRLADLSGAFISKLESNQIKDPSLTALENISRALKISFSMMRINYLQKEVQRLIDKPKSLQDLTLREIPNTYIEVPVVANMHAPGKIMEYLYLPKTGSSHTNLYGVKIKGDCLSPQVKDEDIIIIDKDDLEYKGKKILCYHNGEEHPCIIKCKKESDLEQCEVYGVILWIMKKP